MSEVLRCADCDAELTDKSEIEYSGWKTAFYCNPDCAKNAYFEEMGSMPVDFGDADFLRDRRIRVVNGKLVREDEG